MERHSHNTLTSSFQSANFNTHKQTTGETKQRTPRSRGRVAGAHPKHVTYMRPQEQSTFQPQDLTVCSPAGSSSSSTLGSDGSYSCQSDAANSCSDTHFSIRLHRSFQPNIIPAASVGTLSEREGVGHYHLPGSLTHVFHTHCRNTQLNPQRLQEASFTH